MRKYASASNIIFWEVDKINSKKGEMQVYRIFADGKLRVVTVDVDREAFLT